MKSDVKSDQEETQAPDQLPLPKKKGWSIWIKLLIATPFVLISAAIALPSMLSCGNKAYQSEARTYVGSLNKGQQAYFTENKKFGSNIDVLGVGIKSDDSKYKYSTHIASSQSVFNYGVSQSKSHRSYVGAVFLSQVAASSDVTSLAILCEANALGMIAPPDPLIKDGVPTCASGTQAVGQ